MSTHDEDLLRTALRAQAGRSDAQPVDLDAVKGRARGIRRLRTSIAALSTAAVVALGVPVGVTVTTALDTDDAPPVAGQTPRVTPPAQLVEVSLLDDAQPGGEAPSLPYLRGSELVTAEGSRTVPGEGEPVSVALLGDLWLFVMDEGNGRHVLSTDGRAGETSRVAIQSGPVLSDDGTVAAYVALDGSVHTLTSREGDSVVATAEEVGESGTIAAVLGSASCRQQPGCTVFVNAGEGGVRVVRPDGEIQQLRDFRSVADATATHTLGAVSVSMDGSCSALRAGSRDLWRTCDNSFGPMTPDERYAIGYPAYLDGMGPKSVSVVDMTDGRELVRFADDGRTDTHVRQVVWESDTSLLMTVWDGEDRSWSLLRAGVDGSLTEVETGLPGDAMDPPIHLPVR